MPDRTVPGEQKNLYCFKVIAPVILRDTGKAPFPMAISKHELERCDSSDESCCKGLGIHNQSQSPGHLEEHQPGPLHWAFRGMDMPP